MENIILKCGYYIYKKKYSSEELNKIKLELTVQPKSTFSLSTIPTIIVYKEIKDYLIVPRNYGIEKFGNTKTNIPKGEKINIIFNKVLRPNQLEIIDNILNKFKNQFGGVLSLPCGYGKTIIALYLICILKVKTLIIVHKTFLMNQWEERIKEFTNASIGKLRQKTIDVENKDIVIGMLHSVSSLKYDEEIFKDFGFVVFDEVHHAPSEYFSNALPIISCNKCLGLSATPVRKDKLEKILFWYFGNILYQIKNKISDVTIFMKKFKSEDKSYREYKLYNGEINRAKMINIISELEERNLYIVDIIKNIITDKNRKLLILSDRITHLEEIEKLLNKNNINDIGYYIGKMKQKELEKSEICKIILGTYSMASEGLDIPSLNTLIMMTPRRDIEQVVGRIVRKIDDETKPHVYDIVDELLPSFNRQAKHRECMYNTLGFTIHDDKKNNTLKNDTLLEFTTNEDGFNI